MSGKQQIGFSTRKTQNPVGKAERAHGRGQVAEHQEPKNPPDPVYERGFPLGLNGFNFLHDVFDEPVRGGRTGRKTDDLHSGKGLAGQFLFRFHMKSGKPFFFGDLGQPLGVGTVITAHHTPPLPPGS